MKHLGTLERGEEMGELVKDMDHTWCTCVCTTQKAQQHSSHHRDFPHADHYASNEQVPSHTFRVKLACTAQKAHTLPPPPHTQPLISMCSTYVHTTVGSLPTCCTSVQKCCFRALLIFLRAFWFLNTEISETSTLWEAISLENT